MVEINTTAKTILKNCIKSKYTSNRGRPNAFGLDHYIDVIFKVLRTGMQWNEIDEKLHYTTYFKKLQKWINDGVMSTAFHMAVVVCRENGKITDDDLEVLSLDTSMVKNVRGGDAVGPNHYDRFRNASKVSVVVTKSGLPLGFDIDAANVHDTKMTAPTIEDIKIKISGSTVLADKGYNSIKLKETLAKEYSLNLIYPLKKKQKNNPFTPEQTKQLNTTRHIVENFFSWIKSFRRLRLRFDTSAKNFRGFCYLAGLQILCNRCY